MHRPRARRNNVRFAAGPVLAALSVGLFACDAAAGLAIRCEAGDAASPAARSESAAAPAAEGRQCLPAGASSPDGLKDVAAAAQAILEDDVFGPYFNDILRSSGVALCWDPAPGECHGYFEPKANAIAVGPGLSRTEISLILVHELRHIDQFSRGYALSLDFDLAENVRQAYAVEADAQAFATLFAWERRRAGNGDYWRTAVGLEHYGDIARAFETAVSGGASLAAATQSAFAAWYESPWRRERYRQSTGSTYLDRLDETAAIRRYDAFPGDHFDRLCVMPDGSDYGCRTTPEINGRALVRPTR